MSPYHELQFSHSTKPREMKPPHNIFVSLILGLLSIFSHCATPDHEDSSGRSSIIFATLGRSSYGFDIYTLPITNPPSPANAQAELRLTDGSSVNFNGHFPASSSSVLSRLPYQKQPSLASATSPRLPLHVIYVSERNGSSKINLDSLFYDGLTGSTRKRSVLEVPTELTRYQVTLVGSHQTNGRVSMKDKPSLVGENVIYVSTHENTGVPRTSWAAVYLTHLISGSTRRLTPYGVADFSPAVSPSGMWTAVASYGEQGWGGEVQELSTDVYIFLTQDGSSRVKVVEHGGWPSWADESTLYFHRRGEDGWWSIYRAILPVNKGELDVDSVVTQRVTPPGLHAFTPAASVANKSLIALATTRPGSKYRHIELFDVVLNEFRAVTQPILPNAHHFNPFISPDSTQIGYHRCRGARKGQKSHDLFLENLQNQESRISLFRVDGSFPSFSPDGDQIAYVQLPGLYVVNSDGSDLQEVFPGMAFSTAWDQKRKGIIYTSIGPTFASESTKVDIIAVDVNKKELGYKKLTINGENNAFPSASPDGKWIVFRSGRSGHKNLYIMDAMKGEAGGLYRLTEGPWSDTMCNWSPDGDWIAFASDRHNPGSGSFALYMIHPNGTGLRKLVQSGSGGRANHPWFSPDGKSIVFTSDYAGVSAEPISNPHHYQPYGDIFMIRSDGSGIRRLTHNSYEDGTPTWGSKFLKPVDVQLPYNSQCSFEDCHWLNTSPSTGVDSAGAYFKSTKIECGQ